MTARIAYVGNEADAAGYRLAGARSCVPAGGAVEAAVDEACAAADVLILSAACAQRLPAARLDALVSQVAPLVFVVPEATLEDIGTKLRRELGLEPS
jgi:vacuolar-type H+-ATPase subunit F/Vma7